MRFRCDEGGQIAILAAIVLTALIFAVALVVNTGQFFVVKRAAQGAADAAALASAVSLSLDQVTANARAAAIAAATKNGFTTGVGGTKVTVNIPPSSGRHAGASGHVEV